MSQKASFFEKCQNQLEALNFFPIGLHHQITSCQRWQQEISRGTKACISPGSHLLTTTAECVLGCSGALRNIPQEANYVPSVSFVCPSCSHQDPCDVALIHSQVSFHRPFRSYISSETSEAISSLSSLFHNMSALLSRRGS